MNLSEDIEISNRPSFDMRSIFGGSVTMRAIIAAGFLAAASAVLAQSDPPPLASELPALKILNGLSPSTTPTDRLATLDLALTMLPQPTPFRGLVLCEHSSMLGLIGRVDEQRRELAQCLQLRPDDPRALLALGFAEVANQRVVEGAQLVTRAVVLSPDTASKIEPATMDGLIRQLRYARADRDAEQLTDALANGGWARENPIAFSKMAAEAIRHRLATGNVAGALTLLPEILSPQVGVTMLLDREFDPIWPQIDTWAGGDLSVQRRALLAGARAAYDRSQLPKDRLAYIEALELTGFPAAAIAELEKWTSADPPERDQFYLNMAIVKLGKLLGESGRRAEAIAIMTAALTGPASHDRSVANIVPNLVVQLLMAGAAHEALAVLDRYTPTEQGVESPAALGYFVALRACGLAATGNAAAAETLLRVQTVYATNDRAVELATNCAASDDAKAQLWITQAAKDETRAGALTTLAVAIERTRRGLPLKSLNEPTLRSIASRPDVRAAYNRLGRDLPGNYKPALVEYAGEQVP